MSLTYQQLELRRRHIGSSEIAMLVGESPWGSALDVWLEKTGRGEDKDSDLMRRGRRAETLIAQEFADREQVDLAACDTVVSTDHPIAVATPDRRIVGKDPTMLVECKNVGWRVLPKWRAASGQFFVPTYVVLQGHWQCGVVNARGFHVAAWLGGRDWFSDYFEFDGDLFRDLVVVAERFWRDHVEVDRQPDPDGTARARRTIERLFPEMGAELLSATPEVERLAREYAEARASEREASKRKQTLGNQICSLIGDAQGFAGEWGETTWRPKAGRTAWANVARAMGAPAELIAKHTSAPSRTLKVSVLGAEEEDDGE